MAVSGLILAASVPYAYTLLRKVIAVPVGGELVQLRGAHARNLRVYLTNSGPAVHGRVNGRDRIWVGLPALRAGCAALAYVNGNGATPREVAAALRLVERSGGSLEELLVAIDPGEDSGVPLRSLSKSKRLALEILLTDMFEEQSGSESRRELHETLLRERTIADIGDELLKG
jgi:hypothetical protein